MVHSGFTKYILEHSLAFRVKGSEAGVNPVHGKLRRGRRCSMAKQSMGQTILRKRSNPPIIAVLKCGISNEVREKQNDRPELLLWPKRESSPR